MTEKETRVCDTCGSDDVVKDAWAVWDVELQEWVLDQFFDKGSYCNACEGECTIIDGPPEPIDDKIHAGSIHAPASQVFTFTDEVPPAPESSDEARADDNEAFTDGT